MRNRVCLAALAVPFFATPAPAALPPQLRALVDSALASGNEAEIVTIAKYVRQAAPDDADEIDVLVTAWRSRRSDAQRQDVVAANPLDLWKGQADVGGFRGTGNSSTLGLSAGFDLRREGLDWRHRVRARGDYQENEGVRTRESVSASYEPSYKVDESLSVYGLAQYERDPFLGYRTRYGASIGIGYRAVAREGLTIDINAGPAFRITRFIDGDIVRTPAARGSASIRYTLTPSIKFTNDSTAYLDSTNSTLASTSAIDARIIGALSARLSYVLQYEGDTPDGREPLDTVSRAALVYDF